jgi:Uncharacterized protein conserved in bacteria (DUF2330)
MRNSRLLVAFGALVVASTVVSLEGDAQACGGCFTPTENPTVVTDHRMILSVSKEQSTLYDQIKYSGSPSSFAWVLPISGTVDVGLSADIVFEALDGMTQTRINPPPQNCPPPPDCGGRGLNAPSAAGGAEDSNGVSVTKREVVGPYETVQLKATDANALQSWLAQNQFTVPADVKPVVDQYVAEHFDFLALKLVPGKTVQDMRPVRVTTKGANAVLPLRMVAAGTGPVVGISLWVIGEGRYEAQNFPSFSIATDELAWDWTQQKSNYTELRAQKTTASNGRGWEIESSTIVPPSQVQQAVQYGYFNNGGGGGGPRPADPEQQAQDAYLPVLDAQGNVVKTAVQVREEDLTTLFFGVPTATTRVTRMRGDLAHAALDADLVLTASADQSLFSNVRQLTKELNEPLCPVYNGCDSAGTAPRSEAIARADANGKGESFSCTTASRSTPTRTSPAWLGLGGGFLALALVKAARRRKA